MVTNVLRVRYTPRAKELGATYTTDYTCMCASVPVACLLLLLLVLLRVKTYVQQGERSRVAGYIRYISRNKCDIFHVTYLDRRGRKQSLVSKSQVSDF